MCLRLDGAMTDAAIKTAWTTMDMNGDAKVSLEEFSTWWYTEELRKRRVRGTCADFLRHGGKPAGFVVGDSWGNVTQFGADGQLLRALPNKPAPSV